MATSTTTLYEKKTGKPVFCYLASVDEFLATGNYTVDEPGSPAKPAELAKAKLPGAGREASRRDPTAFKPGVDQSPPPEKPAAPLDSLDEEKPAEEAPKRKPPRRRSE